MPGLPAGHFLFTSESVAEGNVDALCDKVADTVLDACLTQDPDAKVACESCTKTGVVMIIGEITTKANVNYEQVIREAVKNCGYDSEEKGLDWRTMNVIVAIEDQSHDIASAINSSAKNVEEICAGDSGAVFGYATDETPEMVPVSHQLAVRLSAQLTKVRKDGALAWLRPDGKTQVTVEYKEGDDGSLAPVKVHSVVISAHHGSEAKQEQIEADLTEHVVKPILPPKLVDDSTKYILNPSKKFVIGGPKSDAGMTGRKASIDTYGGWGSHGGGSLSGKDATKIERCGSYGARWAAKSLVAAGFCKRCTVQISYAIGIPEPVAVSVNSYGSAKACGKSDGELVEVITRNFDFRPGCLIRDLGLKEAQYAGLAVNGHFGRVDLDLPWEKPKPLK